MASAPADATKQLQKCVEKVVEDNGADILICIGMIDDETRDAFIAQIAARPNKREHLFLLLETYGGIPDFGFQMMRCLQRSYKKITVIVSKICASTGTMMVLGADNLVMCDDAHLGPLDIQVPQHDEVGGRSSSLTPIKALATLREQTFDAFERHFLMLRTRSLGQLTTRTCASIAARLTIGTMQPIYAQIDPIRLGEIQRSMMISYHYGRRLAKDNLREDTLVSLVAHYPSHDCLIDRDEAEVLFHRVRPPTDHERDISTFLMPIIMKGLSDDEPIIRYISQEPKQSKPGKMPKKGGGDGSSGQATARAKARGANRTKTASNSQLEPVGANGSDRPDSKGGRRKAKQADNSPNAGG